MSDEKVVKFPEPLSDIDRQFLELEKQRELIRSKRDSLLLFTSPNSRYNAPNSI